MQLNSSKSGRSNSIGLSRPSKWLIGLRSSLSTLRIKANGICHPRGEANTSPLWAGPSAHLIWEASKLANDGRATYKSANFSRNHGDVPRNYMLLELEEPWTKLASSNHSVCR